MTKYREILRLSSLGLSQQSIAEASAIIYSIVETCKLNNLNIFYYISHLLTEISKHMDDTNLDFLEDLLPWSEKLPEECKKRIVEMK